MSSLSLWLFLLSLNSLNLVRGERRNILCNNGDWHQMSNDGGTWTFYNNDANVLNDCSVTLSGSSSSISRVWLGSSDGATYDSSYSFARYEYVAYVTMTGVGSSTGYSEFGLFHRLTEWDSGSGTWNIGSGYGVFLQTSGGGRIWNRVIDSNGATDMDTGVTDSSIVANSELKISIKVDTVNNYIYDIRLNDVLTHDGLDTSSYGSLSSGSIGIWSYYTDLTVNKVYLRDLDATTDAPTSYPTVAPTTIENYIEAQNNRFYGEAMTLAKLSSYLASDVTLIVGGYGTIDAATCWKLNNLCDNRAEAGVDWFDYSAETGTMMSESWTFCDSSTYGTFYIHAVRHQRKDENGKISYGVIHYLDPTPKQYIFDTFDA